MKFLRRQKYQGCGIKAEWRNGIQIEGGWRRIMNRDGTVLECKESLTSKGRRYIKIEVWGSHVGEYEDTAFRALISRV
jgi:hypothetical protein